MADTPILIRQYREQVQDVSTIRDRLERASIFYEYSDQQWKEFDLTSEIFDWRIESQHLKDEIYIIKKRVTEIESGDFER